MDGDHAVHFPDLLPNPDLWVQDEQKLGSILLDESAPRIQPWHTDGAWHLAHYHLWPGNAAASWLEDH